MIYRFSRFFVVVLAVLLCAPRSIGASQTPSLLQAMAGTWNVTERMWTGSGTQPIALPPALSTRRLIGATFLQDDMESMPGGKPAFTRMAYLNYNAVTKQYEYFSIDTRAPQMMNERGSTLSGTGAATDNGSLSLTGSRFVAPRWGNAVDAAFLYRIVLTPVQKNGQTVRLYFTPVSGSDRREFEAFEYVYKKR